MEAIRTADLTRTFPGITAVDRLTLSVAEGEIFGLVGPDGAGKTTTMRLLTGILRPTAGAAWVAGHDLLRDPEAVKEHIGYMSQRFGLYADLTVLENIDFYADIYGVPRAVRRERIDRLLAFSNLTAFQRRRAGHLSGGMKQKLGLACALVHTPSVLFLDEPTSGVDPVSRREFWRILYQLLRERVTIFLATAYLDEAERCNRLALIHGGRLQAVGTPVEIRERMPGAVIEVRSAQARRAAGALRAQFRPGAVSLFGDRVHVLGDEATLMMERVENTLAKAGIAVEAVSVVEPSLEDVFIAALALERPEHS